ncbi:DUF5906 domain-containing protein [Vibrio mediterranei]|uniref:phage NrS-1 polymerase family protein n=1 Tax=Vibrio mediterranei TaxID=689 RepID=UPI001EFD590D|nr:DUF5906 domain-containing protein [Vibrio mediterranei]MCG9626028.1 DUF5906 domain-containing protein [Vibrio mediterranei]
MQELPLPLTPLAEHPQFILWKLAERNGERVKLPIDYRTAKVGDAHDAGAWMNAEAALNTAAAYGPEYGIGFVFTESDPFFFVDIDHCLEPNGEWSPVAMDLVSRLTGAAVEISQSGQGLHIFGKGKAPQHACKNVPLKLEFYTEGRFVALTGINATGNAATDCSAALPGIVAAYFKPTAPGTETAAEWTTEPSPEWSGPESDDELIEKMLATNPSSRSAFGGAATVRQLWEADEQALAIAYPDNAGNRTYDASSADAALSQHLAFWTGRNCERMDRLFRLSGLYREKWENRPDYRERTITSAAQQCANVYSGHIKPVEAINSPVEAITYRTGHQLLAATQQAERFAGCVYMLDRHRVFTPEGDQLKPEQFNAIYGGYDFVLNTEGKTTRKAWEAFTESQSVNYPWAHGAMFRPELTTGQIVTESGRRLVNVYVPAMGERKAGEVAPFLGHVERLLPSESDREIFLSYLAACVQQPGAKFQWCVVLQGAEGNGKTVFYHVLAYALGERYAHLPNAAEITNPFNAWIEQKLVIGIEELHTAGRQEVADTLKPMITNKRLEIHGKGQDQRTGDNRANFIMFSNHKDAVLKTENDRRYCVFYTAQQEAADLARDNMSGGYFADLYNWLERGGYAHVAEYLATRSVTVDVMGRAPNTSSTAEAVRSSLGVAEQIIQEAIELEEWGFRGGLVCTTVAKDHLNANGKKLSPQKVAGVLANLGYIRHPALEVSQGKVTIAGKRRRIYAKRGSLAAQVTTADAVRNHWERSHDEAATSPNNGSVRAKSIFSDSPKPP